jgi:lysine-specific demethylase/histidyl-hydroxylase NO66
LSPAGGEGLRPHTDPTDAFILQLAGSKSWRVWSRSDRRSGPIDAVDELGPPALETTLEAGDVLYLPHGTPHVAMARESTSLHATLSIEPRTWREVLIESTKQALTDSQFDGLAEMAPADFAGESGLPARLHALADALARLAT